MTTPNSPYLRRINWLLLCMTLIFLAAWLAPQPAVLQGTGIMPLWLHLAAELFSIIVSIQTFGIVWNSYGAERPGNILILAYALLAVGLIDFAHALSFTGMPDLVTPAGPEKAINFWLAARLIAALTLFAVAIRPWEPLTRAHSRYWLLAGFVAITALTYWLGLFHAEAWPRTFVQGLGLTPFKISAEYSISLLLLIATTMFYREAKRAPHSGYVTDLYASAAITILSELCFVLFSQVTDVFNLLGHLYKIAAYLFIYKAVFVSSVHEPFQKLLVAENKIKTSQQMLQSILDAVPVRIFWKDRESRYLGANSLFLQDVGVGNIRQLIGMDDFHLFPTPHAELYRKDDQQVMASAAPKLNFEESISTAAGQKKFHLTSKVPLQRPNDGEVIGVLGSYTDITALKHAEETIRHQANFDPLTNLPNRRLFNDRLDQEIKKSNRAGQPLALLLIDLDRFKEINDTLGHGMGDMLLMQAAQRLRGCVRETDTIARLGGDEFAVILGELNDLGSVERVAQCILLQLAEPFHLINETVYISASIGITLYPEDAKDLEALLQNADQAMYAAKEQGHNRFHYFTSAMQDVAQTRMRLTRDMRGALADCQFLVYYQPIVELATDTIHKAEALIRWQHPTRGLISPAEFIPIAEDTGMIMEIGDWVFREAANQAKVWRTSHHAEFQISINKSPIQFQSADHIQAAWLNYLHELGIPGSGIVVEITEGILMDSSSAITGKLLEFRDAGVQVALDDFGTGYSSLSYLKKFDIDFLKIDQTFIRNLAAGSDDMALCEAIIVMAHKLGIKVIAEGIETAEQCALLAAAGCDYGQGYLFSRPVPAEEFERLLITGPTPV
ncbi:MAG TPA: EAL domain-containing protein [Novimethylophilus sp.]|jgi:diguanylate cyclase (GGDEF)-like protein/PAS domain S-box-containing protein|uniref:bifunctional diguanylate cyclase/phosphodiesterase n=1 Tax=Novimethylophilus sp. TaxID=2137426 RepID=UPI002F4211A1